LTMYSNTRIVFAACCAMASGFLLLSFVIYPNLDDAPPSDARILESRIANGQQFRMHISKIEVDATHAVLARSNAPVHRNFLKKRSKKVVPKIAFLFLLQDTVEQPAVWDSFFRGADPLHFSVYVHCSKPASSLGSFLSLASTVEVPYTASEWCALMGVQVAALREALRDPDNQQFVFVSHNAVPLKSFDYIYRDLIVHSVKKSKFCFASEDRTGGMADCRFRELTQTREEHVLKHHQWIILSRQHAEIVVERVITALTAYDALRDITRDREDPKLCSDESVPGIALLQHAQRNQSKPSFDAADEIWSALESMGVQQRCTTFVYWSGCMSGSELDLQQTMDQGAAVLHPLAFANISSIYLQKLVSSSLLFCRKFNRNAVVRGETLTEDDVAIAEVLPKMWQHVTFHPGQLSPFVRLDAGQGKNS